MMTTRQLQDEILRLKKEKDICILAHAYQSHEILEVADYTGDSYGLSQQAAKAPQKNVLMCGVRFMAETVKILSPEKKVYLSNSGAGCPMAEQLDVEMLSALKESNPDHTVVAYINTTSELKTICDVCVTSSSALKIVNNIDNDKILFIPDCNLGAWVEKQVPQKTFKFVHGGCPTHLRMSVRDVKKARGAHPGSEVTGSSGVSARGFCNGRLYRKYNWNYEICQGKRCQRIYYRNREQHCSASSVRVPGQEILSAVKGLRMPQYETDNLDGCL